MAVLSGDTNPNNFNDTLTGGAENDSISGLTGQDRLAGGLGADTLDGGNGDDQLRGDAGSDSLFGGEGNDLLYGASGSSGVALSGDGADQLLGDAGDDILRGNIGNDSLYGGVGNDNLRGDAGDDLVDGGEGSDSASYRFDEAGDSITTGITFDLSGIVSTATPIQLADGLGGTDTLVRIESFVIAGSPFADTYKASPLGTQIGGNQGNDTLWGGAGADSFEWRSGDGFDTLHANGGDGSAVDQLRFFTESLDQAELLRDGSDLRLNVRAGTPAPATAISTEGVLIKDFFTNDAGKQIDRIAFTDAYVLSTLDTANRALTRQTYANDGTLLSTRIDGLAGNANLTGTAGNDTLIGGPGNDYLGGEAGNDSLDGAEGADILAGSTGTDTLRGGDGTDLLYGANGSSGVDVAGDGADQLFGDGGNDILRGNVGNDSLYGGAGDDNLRGDGGNDLLDGGEGSDAASFRFDEGGYGITAGITFDLSSLSSTATPIQLADGRGGIDTLVRIETLVITGTAFADTLKASPLGTQIAGYQGNDTLWGSTGVDAFEWRAGEGFDTLYPNGGDGNAIDELRVSLPAAQVERLREGSDLRLSALADGAKAGSAPVGGILIKDFFANNAGNQIDRIVFSDAEVISTLDPANKALTLQTYGADGKLVATRIDGLAGNATLIGSAGPQTLVSGPGHDIIDGGTGIDTAVYASKRSDYTLTKTAGGWNVGSTLEGQDSIVGVERLKFTDRNVALDLSGNAGAVAQIIRAVFGPGYLANPDFIGIGLQRFDAGLTYSQAVQLALGVDQFTQLAGGRSNEAFVNFVYRNVVGVLPSAGDLGYFAGQLNSGIQTRASLAELASLLPLNKNSVELVGLVTTGIEFTPPVA